MNTSEAIGAGRPPKHTRTTIETLAPQPAMSTSVPVVVGCDVQPPQTSQTSQPAAIINATSMASGGGPAGHSQSKVAKRRKSGALGSAAWVADHRRRTCNAAVLQLIQKLCGTGKTSCTVSDIVAANDTNKVNGRSLQATPVFQAVSDLSEAGLIQQASDGQITLAPRRGRSAAGK